jgi:hypothetical protein
MLAFLRNAGLEAGDGVSVTSSGVTVDGLLDDEDVIQNDAAGFAVQVRQTVLRVRAGAFTRPTINGTMTTQKGSDAADTWYARDIRNDPANPGMWRIAVSRS